MSGKNPLYSDKYMDTHSRVSSSISGGTHAQTAVQSRHPHNPIEKPTHAKPELRVIEGGKSFPSPGAKNNPPKNQAIPKSLLKRLPPAVLAHPFLWAAVITVVVGKVILEKDDTDAMSGEPFKETDPEEGVNYLVQEIKKYDPDYTYSHDKDEKGVSFLANLLHYEKLEYFNKHKSTCRQDFNPDLYAKTVRDLDAREDLLNTLYGHTDPGGDTAGRQVASSEADSIRKMEYEDYKANGGKLYYDDWLVLAKDEEHSRGDVTGSPPKTFSNHAPGDPVGWANPIAINKLKSQKGRHIYVVTSDGNLIVGKARNQGHIDLAQGADVMAAGEVYISQGKIKWIDNASGHYRPWGEHAQQASENAFKATGFGTDNKYIEKIWIPRDPKVPNGLGNWIPKKDVK